MRPGREDFYTRFRKGLLLPVAASLILSGCAQLGPELVKAGRNDYNKVLAQTDDEETLLNLVRMRYADNPAILQVSSVSTSFMLLGTLTALQAGTIERAGPLLTPPVSAPQAA